MWTASCAGIRSPNPLLLRAVLTIAWFGFVSATSTRIRATADEGVLRKLGYPFANNVSYGEPIRIAVTLPVTTRGEEHVSTRELRFFRSFLPSFVETIVPVTWPCSFEFWVGLDVGDPLLESPEKLNDFISMFYEIVSSVPIECGELPQCFTLSIKRFASKNALTALWNGLNKAAFEEGCHYFFMPNDDLYMETKGWLWVFLTKLAGSRLLPNLGVTGPLDSVSGRADIPSMPFVHRTHMAIFQGVSLPTTFQNWYNDVWLGNVYRPPLTTIDLIMAAQFGGCLMAREVRATNHHGCTDSKHCSRYELGNGANAPWKKETVQGRLRVQAWLQQEGIPTYTTPEALMDAQILIG